MVVLYNTENGGSLRHIVIGGEFLEVAKLILLNYWGENRHFCGQEMETCDLKSIGKHRIFHLNFF